MIQMKFPYLYDISQGPGRPEFISLFSATIPSIPDLSSFEEFKNVDTIEKLRRVINSMKLLLLGLNNRPRTGYRSFELRYIWKDQQLALAILGKGSGDSQKIAQETCLNLWNDLGKLFPYSYFRSGIHPSLTEEAFIKIHQPFPIETAQVVGLRKQVESLRLLRLGIEYPIIYPYKWGISTMTELCKTLTRQDSPYFIGIALFPIERTDEETKSLNVLAGELKKAGEGKERSLRMGLFSTQASSSNQITHRDNFGQTMRDNVTPDPQAQYAGSIYEDLIRRSGSMFLMRPYIASNNVVDPNVVGALQLDMVGYVPTSSDPTQQTPLPHLPEEIHFENEALKQARNDIENMSCDALLQYPITFFKKPGHYQETTSKLWRLPYLVDVDEASCAFRFPVLLQKDEIGIGSHSGAFVALRQETDSEESILIGQQSDFIPYKVTINSLRKHALIAGATGSGKTTTCLHLLAQLTKYQIPFLVIEPVNAEHNDYRSLFRLPELDSSLLIFTLGDETVSPFRLNPFEIQRGITVSEHISSMLIAFKAAIPMWEPLPRIFLKALNRVYFNNGWIPSAKSTGADTDPPFPTLQDFSLEISHIVEHEIEHEGEVKSNLRGASKLRIESLLEGSCGKILSARRSLPIELWMENPSIFELRHLGDDEDKALMMAFLMITITEYLEKSRPPTNNRLLDHLLVIEEAHRLLENVKLGSNPDQENTRGQAAQAFARALAEYRKYGEGVIIAEQMPTKLVPDAIGNTGLKIMFRLTASDDRDIAGKALNLNEFQQEYIAGLQVGQAAVLGDQFDEPVLVRTNNYWDELGGIVGEANNFTVSDSEIAERMQWIRKQWGAYFVPFFGCKLCNSKCKYQDHAEGLSRNREIDLLGEFIKILQESEANNRNSTLSNLVAFTENTIRNYLPSSLRNIDIDQSAYCLFLHLKDLCGFNDDSTLAVEAAFKQTQRNNKGYTDEQPG
jgi:hypothetical protein